MFARAQIESFDGINLNLKLQSDIPEGIIIQLAYKEIQDVEIRIDDGRQITSDQRKKAYALIRAISAWSGDFPEIVKEYLKFEFAFSSGIDWFSLSDTDVTTAREFITYLIDFCIYNGVPLENSRLIEHAEDIERYIYTSIKHRKCAVCGREWADIHHCTGSRIGIGRNRNKVIHIGLSCLPLCRTHHDECHADEARFLKKYHLFGIDLDETLCNILGLNIEAS